MKANSFQSSPSSPNERPPMHGGAVDSRRGSTISSFCFPPLLAAELLDSILASSAWRDDPDDLDGGAGATAGVLLRDRRRRRRGVRAGVGGAAGGAVPGAVPDGAGHGWAKVERVGVRVGPVRRVGRRGEAADDALLQLVLLLHLAGVAAGRHRAGVRPGQPGQALGLRRLRLRHRRGPPRLPGRHTQVPLQEAGRQPPHADRRRRRRRLAQAPPPSPRRPRHALRRRRRQGRRRRGWVLQQEEQAQGAPPPHRPVPLPGPRGDQRGSGGGGEQQQQVAAGDADGRGGGEDGGADAADLGDHDHVLDGVRADDHLLGVAGHHHGPPRRGLVPDPRGLPHRLLRRLHPAHRARLRPPGGARRAPRQRQPARPHPAAADRRRPRALRRRHGGRRAHGGPPPPRRARFLRVRLRRRRAHVRVLAHPAVLPRGGGRGVHVHRPARLLPARVPQGDEDHEHGAVPQHPVAGILRQLRARRRRAQGHGRPPPLDRQRPQQGPPRQLLLAARRRLPRQPTSLPRRRPLVQVQGGPPRRRRQRQRRRDGRRAHAPLIHPCSIDRRGTRRTTLN
uniref:Uncharacterized protein n=1 Tax=Zea mays TaxID=4577 RepID=A0A804RGR2_MAIZE